MTVTSRILLVSLALALAACARTEQEGAGTTAHGGDSDAARAQARISDAHAAAGREINKVAIKHSREQAKADYDVAVVQANGELSVALAKCGTRSSNAKSACEQAANSVHDQKVNAENAKLDMVGTKAG